MYDLNNKFNTFYRKHVVLPKEKKNDLFQKKNLNISRLKKGLEEYNEEHGTDYQLIDHVVQGSVAMSTVVQNEDNDYDIDVAIIFDKDKLPEGTRATKNIIVDALKRKCTGFKKEPEAKTNCVRIEYSEGYHIDFAIYRRYKDDNENYVYEHGGSEWRRRDPWAITKWFLNRNKENDYKLREVVRLLKMFVKSRDHWVNMPGGLVLSVLAEEQCQSIYERMDERFYYTAKAIRDRLNYSKEVYNPTDPTQSLILTKKDEEKLENLRKRLDENLQKLDVLFNSDCTEEEALEAWEQFFNHHYWTEQKEKAKEKNEVAKSYYFFNEADETWFYDDTEEYIENYFPLDLKYKVELDCKVKKNGKFVDWLSDMRKKKIPLLPNRELYFYASTDAPKPYQVYWKVRNRGEEAKKRNCLRGQIIHTDELIQYEESCFKGDHYVECYIVKNGICVARGRIDVPIKA
ncbi:nucleotide-binding domain-containing protein [Parageobacillus thermoglucosidasius]|jgi:Adenylyl/Guanylyl and SMODS C-terminal sensor domain|uniref:nucleotide-binding domain-containing protein n=4 Tax=Anoxybacillaceae TaxID=3120669 RepID=UPI000B575EB3|nr:nucleotidyltransferase [Parageobacillus thermoglucosidasius]MBY6268866.1 nucleotidyltransferase [Parageobacillus thermoglucosidasius]OUM89253.1 MAG: nucleotidyltransferase [Parageobacillus thermoglucosidasius]WJQ07324.1 nucleotidyltransferase [Geobacillus stearothermophilus]